MSLNIGTKKASLILLSIPLLMVIAGCGKVQLEELQSELANERSANESLQKQLEGQEAEAQSAETAQLSKIQELESSLAKMQEREKGMDAQYLSNLSAKNKEVKKYKSAYLAQKVDAGCGKAQLEELQSELANERSANESLQKQLEGQMAEAQSAETAQLSKIQELESKIQEPEKSTFWLNTNTGKRHNSSCRYYHKTKQGRPCTKHEGIACKICCG